MRYRCHYNIGDWTDSFVVEGETIEEIRKIVYEEMDKRGLDADKNDCWSEEI